jgi:D-alanyl-D-alanine carboxypeptidase
MDQGSISEREFEYSSENFCSAELQRALDNKVKELDVPGIQASVRAGDFYWHGTSGSIDLKKKEKLTAEHILRIGSVTKNFTAAIILKLYEREKISLDDTINKWFPKYPKSDLITIRQLLNHSGGIYNYTENIWLGAQSVLLRNKRPGSAGPLGGGSHNRQRPQVSNTGNGGTQDPVYTDGFD